MADEHTRYAANGVAKDERGGFVALTVIAAAAGAGAALLLAPRRSRSSSRREKRLMGIAGLLIGAGLAAVLNPESGPATRQRLGSTWSRIKVGAVDRIDRLRARQEPGEPGVQPESVRTVQELGRDPNAVF
jgi:hypothetical protein